MTPLTLHQHCFNRNLTKVLKLVYIHPVALNCEILKCTPFSTCNSWAELSVGTGCTLYLLHLTCIFWHSASHLSASLCDLVFSVTDYDPLNLHYLSIVSYFPTYVSGIFFLFMIQIIRGLFFKHIPDLSTFSKSWHLQRHFEENKKIQLLSFGEFLHFKGREVVIRFKK